MGNKELVEALKGVLALSAVLAVALKDGVQVSDVAEVVAKLSSEPVKSKLAAALEGIEKVPAEVKDLDVAESLQLIVEVYPDLKAVIDALKKPEAVV